MEKNFELRRKFVNIQPHDLYVEYESYRCLCIRFEDKELDEIFSQELIKEQVSVSKSTQKEHAKFVVETDNQNRLHFGGVPVSLRQLGLATVFYKKMLQENDFISTRGDRNEFITYIYRRLMQQYEVIYFEYPDVDHIYLYTLEHLQSFVELTKEDINIMHDDDKGEEITNIGDYFDEWEDRTIYKEEELVYA